MSTLAYEDVFSRFYSKVNAYNLAELAPQQLTAMLDEWLLSTISQPYVQDLFSSVNVDTDFQEIQFEMSYPKDKNNDTYFVSEVLALGMIVAWLEPQVNNFSLTAQMFGSKEEKFYSQQAHLNELRALKDSVKREQRRLIADRGYIWNDYLGN